MEKYRKIRPQELRGSEALGMIELATPQRRNAGTQNRTFRRNAGNPDLPNYQLYLASSCWQTQKEEALREFRLLLK